MHLTTKTQTFKNMKERAVMASEQHCFFGEKNYIHLLSTVSQKREIKEGMVSFLPAPHPLRFSWKHLCHHFTASFTEETCLRVCPDFLMSRAA